ncbi:conserved Plasmodium protein, unknown function [Plasmodium gallinaceum]|uniref:Uncharacterized protein n=1 Tax=Plasmodium gallinaceum TaxID=5849 RepID=A0A1J1GM46_PLAGA|nr:conserved Plasmodium protein, unknown function [Plasmodium gallinaceum]CRG93428.1 conserved Plasmodium protein, unknown function [Plasmodium gallinaceum]
MNTKVKYHRNFFCNNLFKHSYNNVFLTYKKHFSYIKKIEELKKRILDYYSKDNEYFLQRRKQHEKEIKNYFKELSNYVTLEDIFFCPDEKRILNEETENIKKYIEDNNKKNLKDINDHIKITNEKTELMKILSICGIRIPPKILFYYIFDIISNLKKHLDINKNYIIKYEAVTEKENYFRINQYYYNKKKINVQFFLLYKSLSNVLYSICENSIDNSEIYLSIRDEIYENYCNLSDIIIKSPSFLNVSILFYFINVWLFSDKSRKMKIRCLENLNKYINSISDDEININKDDLFYFFLTIRLFFFTFSYSDVLNNLNNYSKHFISSVLFFPHNSEKTTNQENENYKYIINYLNKNEKYVEFRKIQVFPFNFSLSSLKNKIIYIFERPDDYYENDTNVMRSYNYWKYFIAKKEDFKLLTICNKHEFNELYDTNKRDDILTKYVNKDYLYNFEEKIKKDI